MVFMEDISAIALTGYLIAIAAILLTLKFWPMFRRKDYPPGPIPWPFIGNIEISFAKDKLNEVRKQYGDVVTVWAGQTPVVFLLGYEAIHEAFITNAEYVSERPQGASTFAVQNIIKDKGLINEEAGKWKPLRKHALTVFRDKGIGRSDMEIAIAEECTYFLQELENHYQPFNIKSQITQSISNVITRVIFGRRIDYSSEQLENLQFVDYLSVLRKSNRMPFIKYIPGDPFKFHAKKKRFEAGLNFAKNEIRMHRATQDPASQRDFIDSFLLEMKDQNVNPETGFHDGNLLATVMQLYIAGTDTTSTTLYWAFLFMILYPDVQRKVQQEMNEVLGERNPQYSDRNILHYTHAVITEVLRTCIAQASLPHSTVQDITVRGQTIPKGTIVLASLWSLCYDKDLYKDPSQFRPERFLDIDGHYIKPDKSFLPFSLGRRACLGESLARTELFIFFTSTLRRFTLSAPPGEKLKKEGFLHFVYTPEPYKLSLTKRD